jgi:hypothetical protein
MLVSVEPLPATSRLSEPDFFNFQWLKISPIDVTPIDVSRVDRSVENSSLADSSVVHGRSAGKFVVTGIGGGAFATWDVIECWFGDHGGIGKRHRERHGDVDVFEDLPRGDADYAIERFDEIVSFATAMLAAKGVGKSE